MHLNHRLKRKPDFLVDPAALEFFQLGQIFYTYEHNNELHTLTHSICVVC